MIVNLNSTTHILFKLLSFSLLISSVEYLSLKQIISNQGIWKWDILKLEFINYPRIIKHIYAFLLSDKIFNTLLVLRFILSARLFFAHDLITMLLLLICSIIISQKFRGSFNGGSDYMTILTLACVTIGTGFPGLMASMLMYLAIQTILSYFFAGIVKLKNPDWRNGLALFQLSDSCNYKIPEIIKGILKLPRASYFIGWCILSFELLFPLIFFAKFTFLFIAAAIIFHIVNFLCFGLNRFFWTWLATYPAVIFTIANLN